MGLTIHYSLQLPGRDMAVARSFVEQLHRRASELPFEDVGPLVELSGESCDFENCEPNDPNRWLLIQSRQLLLPSHVEVKPTSVLAFSAYPGAGSEPANFGLCHYPATAIDQTGKVRRTRLSGWRWSSFCKTQYASDSSLGDVANFLRCHLAVVQLLDHAKLLGVLTEVTDEGGYFEGRDVEALVREVARWNEAMAGFAGFLIVADTDADVVVLDNCEILFDRSLQLDPLRLLQLASRNRTVVASWNGTMHGGTLTYAEPQHPEHRAYGSVDAVVLAATGTITKTS